MRGADYMRMGRCRRTGEEVCHLLHAVARSHKLVCRASFGSELLAACGAADGPQAFLLTMHEMINGPADPSVARRLREEGGYAAPAELVVDGMSVFSACCQTLSDRLQRTAWQGIFGGWRISFAQGS